MSWLKRGQSVDCKESLLVTISAARSEAVEALERFGHFD